MQTNSPRRATPLEREAGHRLSGKRGDRAHELSSGWRLQAKLLHGAYCCMGPIREPEKVQDEEILPSPLHCTN